MAIKEKEEKFTSELLQGVLGFYEHTDASAHAIGWNVARVLEAYAPSEKE